MQQTVGQVDRYMVLDKQITALRAQMVCLQIEVARLSARVDLHLAVGGTFFDTEAAPWTNGPRREEVALR